MSVSIDWIHTSLNETWNWHDLHKTLAKVPTNKPHSRATIVLDFLGNTKLSKQDLRKYEQKTAASSQKVAFVIIADEPVLAKNIGLVLSSLFPQAESIVTVNSHEEALSLIRETLESGNKLRA
jgi:hypothetical protein